MTRRLGTAGCVALAALTLATAVVVTVAATARPAAATDPNPDADDGVQWEDEGERIAFEACREMVEWVAHGQEGDRPAPIYEHQADEWPGGIAEDLWSVAIDYEWLNEMHIQQFDYRPRCHVLLPDDYTSQVTVEDWSETFSRCLTNVNGEDRSEDRPSVVPAWYWEASLAVDDCSMLLPLGAFGLGGADDEENAWSDWSSDDDPEPPEDSDDPAVMTDYGHCVDYIQWRMDGAATFTGLGSLYDEPPENSVPQRVWHEALDYFADPSLRGGTDEVTLPHNWKPKCDLLLLTETCKPDKDALVPDECLGPHPSSHYDIGYAEYESDDPNDQVMPSVSRNLWGGMTGLTYQLGKGAVVVSLWTVGWAYGFDIRKYDALALDVGDAYETNLLGHRDFRLRELLWLVLAAWAGVMALRGRLATAGSEILLTIVLLLVAAVLMAHRDRYLTATWDLMDKASNAVLVAGMGGDAAEDDGNDAARKDLVADIRKEIHRIFVEDPYDHLNWGRSLGDPNDSDNAMRSCAAARYYIVSRGPHGTDRWPRDQMTDIGGEDCGDLVEFNRDPTGTRLIGAVLVLVSAVFMAILMGLIALTIVAAKLVSLLLFGVASFAVVCIRLPGGGRRLWWSWCTGLLQMVTVVIGMSFLLSVLLITLKELNELTGDISLIERFLLMNLVVLLVFGARRSLLSSGQRFASQLRDQLSTSRGSGATWAGAGGSEGGASLAGVDRGVAYEAGAPIAAGVGAPIAAVYRRNIAMRRARYGARLGYKNLRNISKWKRRKNARSDRWLKAHREEWPPKGNRGIPTRRRPLP